MKQPDYLTYPNHNLLNIFLTSITNLLMYSFINCINRSITKGEKSNSPDLIIKIAIVYHGKYAKKKKYYQDKI